MTLEFYRHIFERVSNFIKIRPLGSELFHADMTKLTVAFLNFANAAKKKKRITAPLSLTSVLDGNGPSHAPAASTQEKKPME
jgi:hypothetical protein